MELTGVPEKWKLIVDDVLEEEKMPAEDLYFEITVPKVGRKDGDV